MSEELFLTLDGNEPIRTFGGESWIDDWYHADYGIDFPDASISGISPDQFACLAAAIVSHMSVNGHEFQIVADGCHQTLIHKKP
jgi:hypothetical protein